MSNKATEDQIAAVMLQHGTPAQQQEALRYCSRPVGPSGSDVMLEIKIRVLRNGALTYSTAFPTGAVAAPKVMVMGALSAVTALYALDFKVVPLEEPES